MNVVTLLSEACDKQDWSMVADALGLLVGTVPGKKTRARPKAKAKARPRATPSRDDMPRRPPFRLVDVVCTSCQRKMKEHPDCVPVALEGHLPNYVCNSCLVGQRRRHEP